MCIFLVAQHSSELSRRTLAGGAEEVCNDVCSGISVGNWRPHVLAVLLSVMHEAVKMAAIYDQLSAQVDCADVCEMLGAGRKRHLLLSEVIRVLSLRDAGGNSYMLRRVCESLGTQILRKPADMTRQQVWLRCCA